MASTYPVPDVQRVDDGVGRFLRVRQKSVAFVVRVHRPRLVDDDDEVLRARCHRLDVKRPEITSTRTESKTCST